MEQWRSLRHVVAGAGVALVFLPLVVQAQRRSDYYWLSGGLSYSRFALEVGDASRASRNGATIRMGLRICALCAVRIKRLTITPGLAYGFTDLRGLDVGDEPYAFSRLDFGVQAAFTIPGTRVRPYVSIWPKAQRTSELANANGSVENYKDEDGESATTYGIEVALTREGRGLDLSVTSLEGVFRKNEPSTPLPPIPYKGRVISIGWSGSFTGAGLPWR